jgi:hypothetical protein
LPKRLNYDIVSPMKKGIITALILSLIVVGLSFGATKLYFNFRGGGLAGLKINSVPQASVFIDDKFKSKTLFDEKLSAGKYLVKLTPDGDSTETSSWEKEIALSPGLLTYINRELGPTDVESAGEILWLEEINEGSQISVISTPDGATVALDGQEKGTSPMVIDTNSGDHTLFVLAPGFKGRQIKVTTTEGYKLNAEVQLALVPGEEEATDSAETSETDDEDSSAKVKILDTPTGWLRVRSEPSLSGEEVDKVDPDDAFKLLDETEGWYKIEIEKDREGWISSRYAEKIEE